MDATSDLPAAGEQTVWIGASEFIAQVCDELEVGQYIHGENFSLFEAMSALEIMDPKMDAGMELEGPNTAEDVIENGGAPIDLTILQLIDIMDHLLACEATWLRGHPLAQTVFSCLYLLNLDRTSPNALLHAYCQTTRATCSLIRTAVSITHPNEEQQLLTISFGLPLEVEGDGKCLSALHSVEEVIARQLRACKGTASRKKVIDDLEPLQKDPTLEEGFCKSILCRVRFRKAMYHVVANMNKPQGRGLDLAHKNITAALLELKGIQQYTEFLVQCSENDTSKHVKTTASGQEPVGFDARVTRQLCGPMPPRSINILSWTETVIYFEKLLQDLELICSLETLSNLEEVFDVVVDFQKRDPDLVARAFLQRFLVDNEKLFGHEPMHDVLGRALGVPESISSEALQGDNYITKAGQLTLDLLRILCTNIAWQRRKLGKLLMEWGLLLQQAETLFDCLLQKTLAPLKEKDLWVNVVLGWTAEQTSWIVVHFLMLGFQLDLYVPSELCMVYWYLDHALTQLYYEKRKRGDSDRSDSSKKKGKKKKGSLKGVDESNSSHVMCLLQCYIDLCKGLSWMISALITDKKIVERHTIFNTQQERFLQRFELFQRVPFPQPLSYLHFRDFSLQKRFSVKEQYQLSNQFLVFLQQHLQELNHLLAKATNLSPITRMQRTAELRQLEQVALRNRIVLQIVDRAEAGNTLRISFDFSQHPCFAVASIKKS